MIKGCLFLRRTEEEPISLMDQSTSHKAYLTQMHTHTHTHTHRPGLTIAHWCLRLLSPDWLRGYCSAPWKHRIFDGPLPKKEPRGWEDEGELPLTTPGSPKWPSENEKRETLLREKCPGEATGLNLSQLFKRGYGASSRLQQSQLLHDF